MKLITAVLVCIQLGTLVMGTLRNCDCVDCRGSLELAIVLDSSSSIAAQDFEKAKTFLQDFIRAFEIGPNFVRVSFVHYGRDVHSQEAFFLNTHATKQEVIAAIGEITHHSQPYTNTGGGIEFMRKEQLNQSLCREGVERIALVVTDGNSQEYEHTADEARLARESGIIMFSVGIGQRISWNELLNIAGDDDRVNRVESYDHLTDLTRRLSKETCEAANLNFIQARHEL